MRVLGLEWGTFGPFIGSRRPCCGAFWGLGRARGKGSCSPFTKARPGFRPSGRCSPFKTAPGGFVSSQAQLRRAGAEGGGASPWSAEGVLALTGALEKPGTGTLLAWRASYTVDAMCAATLNVYRDLIAARPNTE
jgi:hypothetical protein